MVVSWIGWFQFSKIPCFKNNNGAIEEDTNVNLCPLYICAYTCGRYEHVHKCNMYTNVHFRVQPASKSRLLLIPLGLVRTQWSSSKPKAEKDFQVGKSVQVQGEKGFDFLSARDRTFFPHVSPSLENLRKGMNCALKKDSPSAHLVQQWRAPA